MNLPNGADNGFSFSSFFFVLIILHQMKNWFYYVVLAQLKKTYQKQESDIVSEISSFDRFGQKTEEGILDGVPYFYNKYWTSAQRQAHAIHEVSYRACFKPQLPEFFISRLTKAGDVVLDPFMGRGTTPVQAALMGRTAVGNDANPLCVLMTRPRLRPIDMHDIESALRKIDWSRGEIVREELLAFYHPETLKKLEALRSWISERAPVGEANPDPVADWIRMVAINRLSGHSPGFFSGRTMPPNQAVSVEAQIRINERLGATPPRKDVASIIMKKSRSLLRHGCVREGTRFFLSSDAACDLKGIADGAVDLVVTSPPFLDVVDYVADNWLRCWFAGIDARSVSMSIHRNEKDWMRMVRGALAEQARVLKRGGHVAFEVGEVRGGRILLEQLVWKAADDLPFERLGVMVNVQEFTKTSNCWGVKNGAKGTNTNRIVLLRRL